MAVCPAPLLTLGGTLLTNQPLPEFLTVDEAAALLRVNRKTVYAAIAVGQIKCLRVGPGKKVFRIPRADLETGMTIRLKR